MHRRQIRGGRQAPAVHLGASEADDAGRPSDACSKLVKALRTSPPAGKQPFLLRRWNSTATSPGNATAWTDTPLSQSQASVATFAVMRNALGDDAPKWKERPMPSYVARRLPSTIAGSMGMSARLRGTLGNWRNITDKDVRDESVSMALRYDASKTQANLQSKLMCAFALHTAVKRRTASISLSAS